MVNRSKAIWLFVAVVAVVVAIGMYFSKPTMTLVDALTRKIANPKESDKEIAASLTECMSKCSTPEKDLAKRMLNALTTFQKTDKSGVRGLENAYQVFYAEIVPIYTEMLKLYENRKDTPNVLKVYSAAMLQIASSRAVGFMHPGFNQTIFMGIESWVNKNPNNAHGHGLRGSALSLQNLGVEAVLDEYVKCLKLDPSEEICQRGYRVYSAEFTRPRCNGPAVKPVIAAYVASKKQQPGFSRVVTIDKEKYYLQKDPIIKKEHFKAIFPEGTDLERSEVRAELTPDGTNLLFAMTDRFRGQYLVSMFDGKPLNALLIADRVFSPNLRFTVEKKAGFDPQKVFAQVCSAPTQPTLPAHLQLQRAPAAKAQ